MSRYLLAPAVVLLAFAPARAQEPERFALLVGISKYEHLPAGQQLRGCVNDVKLMKQLFMERLKFEEKQIRILTDEKARAKDIRAALAELSKQVKALPKDGPPVPVVFQFSGHGSQIPDQPPGHPDHDEEDGLDETIVPYDAKAQGGDEDIRDDELNRFVHDVCSHPRARLWVILDCCHSGGGTRGILSFRQLKRGLEVVPPKKLEIAPEALARKTLPANCVMLAACLSDQVEPEYREGGTDYGLLTYFLARVIFQAKDLSKLTYKDVRERITAEYRISGVSEAPTVVLEGSEKSVLSSLLGASPQPPRELLWKVEADGADPGKATISAGCIHGMVEDSLFEVYANPADIEANKPPIALLRTLTVGTLSSEAEVRRWADKQQSVTERHKLPPDLRTCYAREIQKGLPVKQYVLRVVMVDQKTKQDQFIEPTNALLPPVVKAALTGATGPTERVWFRWADNPNTDCDTLLRIDGDYAAYFPATGVTAPTTGPRDPKVPDSLRGGWGPIRLRSPAAPLELRDTLRRIAKAKNLLAMATNMSLTPDNNPLKVTVEVGKAQLNTRRSVASFMPLTPDIKLTAGGLYAYRITNHDKNPVYVTLLGVNRNLGIELIHPASDVGATVDDQKVASGKAILTDAFEVTEPLGERTVVVLATEQPLDFSYLLQSQLPQAQSSGVRTARIARELERQMFFGPSGKVEALTPVHTDDSYRFTMWVLRWETARKGNSPQQRK